MDISSKRQQTKQRILSATKQLVFEKGCRKTTLNEIMQRTGLSKGAIYHYVTGKDELLAWVLEESFEDINDRFFDQINKGFTHLKGPLQAINQSLPPLQDSLEPTNQIFIYLLGQSDNAHVQDVIQQFYNRIVNLSKQWIVSGQDHGVVSSSIDADKTAEIFLLISFGFRMRSAISSGAHAFNADDLSSFMTDTLRPKS